MVRPSPAWLWAKISRLTFPPAITDLYLRAASLHMHLSSFFDDPSLPGYRERLLALHSATCNFLETALSLEINVGPVLPYAPYYVFQMMLAGGFALMKLCKSFFSAHIDLDYTKRLFNRTIWSIRAISVSNNDLPQRLTEVLTQMWKQGGSPTPRPASASSEIDDSLQLKVRCRMSVSLVYDSVWRWREDALAKGRNIEGTYITHDMSCESKKKVSLGRILTICVSQPPLKTPLTLTPMASQLLRPLHKDEPRQLRPE